VEFCLPNDLIAVIASFGMETVFVYIEVNSWNN